MKMITPDEIRQTVRHHYGMVANSGACGCNTGVEAGCCSPGNQPDAYSRDLLGYSKTDLDSVVEGANMNLGCGNPVAIGELKPGEIVLDLGSGGGFDSFLAAQAVGPEGRVIGVDMTPEMVLKARENAVKMKATNVSFRLGEIEHLPVADASVDVILSNCVINLSPDKPQIWREAYRVLRPGGRLAISDIVTTEELPEELRRNLELVAACIGGAATIDETEQTLRGTGFHQISIKPREGSQRLIQEWLPETTSSGVIVSANIAAVKPAIS